MNHSYYQKWQSQEHTNVQIKVKIPFPYFAAFNSQCLRFIVNHRVRFFSDISRCKHRLFFNFSDIFLISQMSDPSDFLLNRAVRAVLFFLFFIYKYFIITKLFLTLVPIWPDTNKLTVDHDSNKMFVNNL